MASRTVCKNVTGEAEGFSALGERTPLGSVGPWGLGRQCPEQASFLCGPLTLGQRVGTILLHPDTCSSSRAGQGQGPPAERGIAEVGSVHFGRHFIQMGLWRGQGSSCSMRQGLGLGVCVWPGPRYRPAIRDSYLSLRRLTGNGGAVTHGRFPGPQGLGQGQHGW